MRHLHKIASVAFLAAFFVAGTASAQNPGTVANHAVAVGKGAGKQGFTSVGPGTAAFPYVSNGASLDGSFQFLTVAGGGTGFTSYTIGDILQASASGTLARLAAVATGNVLLSGGVGVVSSWGKVGLTTHVTGVLPTANGGTGGTLPVANGGTGDTGTAWTTFVPAFSCGTATFTVNSARYKILGKTAFLEVDVTIATLGTCTATINFSLPSVTAQSGGGMVGREYGVTGKGFVCDVRAASATASCSLADAANFQLNARGVASGVIEIQ